MRQTFAKAETRVEYYMLFAYASEFALCRTLQQKLLYLCYHILILRGMLHSAGRALHMHNTYWHPK